MDEKLTIGHGQFSPYGGHDFDKVIRGLQRRLMGLPERRQGMRSPTPIDDVVEDILNRSREPNPFNSVKELDVQVEERETEIMIRAIVPGLTDENIAISLQDGDLMIKADYTKNEFGLFKTVKNATIELDEETTKDAITATLDAGILTLTVKKPEQAIPESISIQIQK